MNNLPEDAAHLAIAAQLRKIGSQKTSQCLRPMRFDPELLGSLSLSRVSSYDTLG